MRLLVIEDECDLCEDIAKKLRLSGYEADTCVDGEAALELLGLVAALLELAVGFGALLVDLVLGFENRFPLFGFAGLDGLVDDARRFGLGGADLFFRNTLAVQKANDNAHNETHDTGHERYDDVVHCFGVSSY